MQVKIRTRVLSAETKTSRKTGNPYTILNFMDGNQVVNAMVNSDCPVNITPFNEYDITLDINLRYNSARVVWVAEGK